MSLPACKEGGVPVGSNAFMVSAGVLNRDLKQKQKVDYFFFMVLHSYLSYLFF